MTTQRSDVVWHVLATVAVLCLVVLTAIVVRREFFEAAYVELPGQTAARNQEPGVPVDDWERVSGAGHRIGPRGAPVTIVEFSDFECPSCARFATQTFPALQARFPGQVALLYRHWPLRNHRLAYPAARAAECAAAQGRFEAFHDLLFAQRDSLPLKTFPQFAKEAGVRDLAAFQACATDTAPVPAIESDLAEARRIGGTGTPTLVINGILVRSPYSPSALAAHIQGALDRLPR